MKKLICLLLVICLLCPMLSGCVNQDADLRMKKAYLRQFGIKDVEPEDVVIDYDGGTYNGARIVMLDAEWHDPETKTEYFGKAAFEYYDGNRLLVYKYGRFFDLYKAFSLSILQEEDYTQIAKEYRTNVKSFMDICDKYDFESCREIKIGSEHIDIHGKEICNNHLWIVFDKKVIPELEYPSIKDDLQKIAEYINSFLDTSLVDFFSPLVDYGYQSNEVWLDARINNDNLDNLPNIMDLISTVPGVTRIYCHCLYGLFGAQAANDDHYGNGLWGLEYIEVDKVWDFTVGSLNI